MDDNKGELVMRKNMKKLAAAFLSVGMILSMSVPGYANVTSTERRGTTTYVKTDNAVENYPAWIWRDGACYYYDASGHILKNTTTPDGYTVDGEGRWTVNGVVQSNGFGNYVADISDYAGKNDDELWKSMKRKLAKVYEGSIPSDVSSGSKQVWTYTISDNDQSYDVVAFDADNLTMGPGESWAIKGYAAYPDDVFSICMGNNWSDMANNVTTASAIAHYSDFSYLQEKLLKTVLGNNVGGEFFNYIKAYADQTVGGYVPELDANGNVIHGYDGWESDGNGDFVSVFRPDPNAEGYKMKYVASGYGDGINTSLLNLNNWQNRTTDYGRKFSIGTDGGSLVIHFTK